MDRNAQLSDSAVAESQNYSELSFLLVGAAAGSKLAVVGAQKAAGAKIHALVGNGAGDLLTSAQATELVRDSSGNVSAERAAIAADLVVLGTNVPAAGTNTRSLVFALGGLSGQGEVLAVEALWNVAADGTVKMLRDASPVVQATSESSPALSNGLIFYKEADVLFAALNVPTAAAVPGASDAVLLKVYLKV